MRIHGMPRGSRLVVHYDTRHHVWGIAVEKAAGQIVWLVDLHEEQGRELAPWWRVLVGDASIGYPTYTQAKAALKRLTREDG